MKCRFFDRLVKRLKKIALYYPFLQILLLSSGFSHAYVLEGPHILHLAVAEMGAPARLRVSQNLTIYDQENNATILLETTNYNFPEQFRSDITTDHMSQIYVFSRYNAVTIINEKTSSTIESLLEYYKDPLLFRNRQLLLDRLTFLGVDIGVTSLGRFEDKMVYIIGAVYPDETRPQLWVGKESFLPARLLLLDQSDPEREKIVEFRYLSWMKTEKTYYPMRIETYIDSELIRTADAFSVKLHPDFDENFFNINHLQTIYPPAASDPYEEKQSNELDDVQQSIEDLKRRFD